MFLVFQINSMTFFSVPKNRFVMPSYMCVRENLCYDQVCITLLMTVLFMRKEVQTKSLRIGKSPTMVFKELIFFFTWKMINLFISFSEAISFTGFIISSCDFNIVSRASPLSELLLDVGLSFSSSTNSLLFLYFYFEQTYLTFWVTLRNTWQNEIKFFISHQN